MSIKESQKSQSNDVQKDHLSQSSTKKTNNSRNNKTKYKHRERLLKYCSIQSTDLTDFSFW